jgi:RNA polymerase sigma-70 factor (ECF subfamily)
LDVTETPNEPELRIRERYDAGDLEAAASAAIQAYGPEILSFLGSRLRGQGDAQEAFSMFAEDLWSGLPKFSWRCTMRTWSYVLARNAARRYSTAPHRGAARNLPLTRPSVVCDLVEHVRTTTQMYQRTDVKHRVRSLREALDVEDQMLLVLRVDRGLAWRDLAIAMSGNADLGDAEVEREAARLRKAFERVKSELKRMAQREGLLKRDE